MIKKFQKKRKRKENYYFFLLHISLLCADAGQRATSVHSNFLLLIFLICLRDATKAPITRPILFWIWRGKRRKLPETERIFFGGKKGSFVLIVCRFWLLFYVFGAPLQPHGGPLIFYFYFFGCVTPLLFPNTSNSPQILTPSL